MDDVLVRSSDEDLVRGEPDHQLTKLGRGRAVGCVHDVLRGHPGLVDPVERGQEQVRRFERQQTP